MILLFLVIGFALAPRDESNPNAKASLAASCLRTLHTANETYAEDHPQQGYARELSDLSDSSSSPENGKHAETMISPILAGGNKGGYKFTYSSQSTKGDGKLDAYQILADPLVPGETGKWHFFMDETGVIHRSDTGPANATSDILGQ
jgi:hypothetical protein